MRIVGRVRDRFRLVHPVGEIHIIDRRFGGGHGRKLIQGPLCGTASQDSQAQTQGESGNFFHKYTDS